MRISWPTVKVRYRYPCVCVQVHPVPRGQPFSNLSNWWSAHLFSCQLYSARQEPGSGIWLATRHLNRNKYFSILVFRPGSDKAFVTTAIANSHHDHWSYVSIKFSLWWHSHGLKLVSHYRLRNSRKWYDGNQVKFRRSYYEIKLAHAKHGLVNCLHETLTNETREGGCSYGIFAFVTEYESTAAQRKRKGAGANPPE